MSAQSSARGLPEIPWNGVLVASTVLAAVVSIIFILDDTKWPDPVWRLRAFQYLLRDQDIAGSILAIAIVLIAVGVLGLVALNAWQAVLFYSNSALPWGPYGMMGSGMMNGMMGYRGYGYGAPPGIAPITSTKP